MSIPSDFGVKVEGLGVIHRHEIDISENVDGSKTVKIERDQNIDEHGVINAHTEIVEIEVEKVQGGERVHRHEMQIDEDGKDSIIRERNIDIDENGDITVEEAVPQVKHSATEELD